MRDKLGVLLVEAEDGGVSVQLFEDPDRAAGSFEQLKGKPEDKPSRATFLDLRYGPGGVSVGRAARTDLPLPAAEPPDGWVVGEGPRRLP